MLDFLIYIDLKIFLFINQTLSNSIFDFIMPLFDNPKYWIIPILICWIIMAVKDKQNRYRLLALIPIVVLLCDQTGAFIKNFELRERPWFFLGNDIVNHLGGFGGKHKSFPSNHAANITGIATILSGIYQERKEWFYMFAFMIMFSRVYIGVHYPADIAAGAIIGISIGLLLNYLWLLFTTNSEEYHQEF